MVTFYEIFDDDISKLGLTNHKSRPEEAQKIALLGTAHIVRSLLMSKPQSNFFTLRRILQPLYQTFSRYAASYSLLYTTFEQLDTRLVRNLKFNTRQLSWCVFNSDDITRSNRLSPQHESRTHSSLKHVKGKPTVKFNPNRFSNPGFFFKEEPMNYSHDVFSTLTLLHQFEDDKNLKTQHEKENLQSLSFSLSAITVTLQLRSKTKVHFIFKFRLFKN